MLTEEQKKLHKEFRTFLRTEQNVKGEYLNMLMKAAQVYLPEFIVTHIDSSFSTLYNSSFACDLSGQL